MECLNIICLIERGVACGQIDCARVNVDRPHTGLGRLQSHRDSKGTPAAAQIKEGSTRGKIGGLGNELACPQVNASAGKHAIAYPHFEVEAPNMVAKKMQFVGGGWLRIGEVLFIHAVKTT